MTDTVEIVGENGTVTLTDVLRLKSPVDASGRQGCFTHDDTNEAKRKLKNGPQCACKSIKLPPNIKAYYYTPTGAWNGICKGKGKGPLASGQTHDLTGLNVCAFRFESDSGECTRGSNGKCEIFTDFNLLDINATMDNLMDNIRSVSKEPCAYLYCDEAVRDVVAAVRRSVPGSLQLLLVAFVAASVVANAVVVSSVFRRRGLFAEKSRRLTR